jgi:hypothetical protein
MSEADRLNIREILLETKPEFAAWLGKSKEWTQASSGR